MATHPSRRTFLRQSLLGLGVATASGLTLKAGAQPTESSGGLGSYGDYLTNQGESIDAPPAEADLSSKWTATEPNILGPFHRTNAPYRGKITPPLEPGTVLLIAGTLWGLDTQKPLPGVTLDIWQANIQGRYDNDDPLNPPAPDIFLNRARVLTDEHGRYEYETIHPGAYKTSPTTWRPPHIHYLVRAKGYKPLITQLYFSGDPHQAKDAFIHQSLIIDLEHLKRDQTTYEVGTFDIILAPT
jgi:protocatechuate 3,4-dioxygenase beta subunit